LAVRDTIRPNDIPGFNMLEYWEDTLRRAVGAKLLAKHVEGSDTDEAFTIGLLQDFGLLAMMIAMPEHGQHWERLRRALPDNRRDIERELFHTTHDEVARVLAKTWDLPEGIAIPMAHHHKIDDSLSPSERTSSLLARGADLLAAVYSAEKKSSALERCRGFLSGAFGLDDGTIDTLLAALPDGVEEAATALGLRVTIQPKLDEVMRAANRHLVEENLCYQEFTRKLERLIEEKDNLTRQLKEANERLEQLAHYDGLTGLMNRRRFYEILPAEISRHARNGKSLSLVMVDLDHFKSINDTYGHPFGDRVLREVSNVIQNQLRGADIKARVGGEELAVLLPESDTRTAHQAIERVRRAIESLQLETDSGRVRVTASFGGCTFQGPAQSTAEVESIASELVFFADQALYEAKRSGRNRVNWQAIAASKAA